MVKSVTELLELFLALKRKRVVVLCATNCLHLARRLAKAGLTSAAEHNGTSLPSNLGGAARQLLKDL